MAQPVQFGQELLDAFFAFDAGMNRGIAPLLLPSNQLANAENVTVRGTFATHRPAHAIRRVSEAGSQMLRAALTTGKFQGACDYVPESDPGLKNLTIMMAIGGRVFQAILSDTPITVREITIPGEATIFSPTAPQVWMWQSEKWVIGNDGAGTAPMIFDNATARRSQYLQQDLGIVAAGSPAAPAIGSTIVIPLEADYMGPDNVVVTICGTQWEISKGPGLTSGFEITLSNCGDATNAVKPAGTDLMIDPGLKALIEIGDWCPGSGLDADVRSYVSTDPGFGCIPTDPILGAEIDRAYTGAKGDQITISGFSFTVFSFGASPAFSLKSFFACGLRNSPVAQPCDGYEIYFYPNTSGGHSIAYNTPGCTPLFKQGEPPPYSAGKLFSAFSPPPQGGTATAYLTSDYTGPLNQIVLIDGKVYKITAKGAGTAPVPSVVGKNLNQTAGTPVSAGCHLLTIPELKPGRMGVYGMGRNWYSLVDPRRFRGADLVGSSSGTAVNQYRDAVLREVQNLYLAEGGDFIVPGNVGGITAMRFTATLDTSLGQGPLQVFTPENIFSCQAPFDNTVWQDLTTPILTQALIGYGAEGHNSTICANSDILFRSSIGLASEILGRREFDTWGNVPISREVEPIIEPDQSDILNFGSSINFDNRFLTTAEPIESPFGVYHTKMIALNFDPISSLRGKQPSVYDGPWIGLNVLQLIKGRLANRERGFAVCLNLERQEIEIFELLKAKESNYDNGGQRIQWTIEAPPRFRYPPDHQLSKTLKRLADGEIHVDELIGLVNFDFFYKPDQHPDWIPWFSWAEYSPDGSVGSFRPRMGLGEPNPKLCDEVLDRPYREAYTFQVKGIITGHCRVLGGLFKCITVPQQMFAPQMCEAPEVPTLELPDIETVLCSSSAEYDQDLLVTGLTAGEVRWEVISGALPPGIVFTGGLLPFDEAATLEGAPTQSGVFTFTVRAAFGGITADREYQLIVVQITSPALPPSAVLGVPYSFALQQSPATAASWSLVIGEGGLPPGLSLSTAGVLSGTPIGVPAVWNFTAQATGAVLGVTFTCQKEFRVTVNAAGGEVPMACIPELDEWSVPAGKFVDLMADSPSLPAIIQGNGNVLQMSGSCPPYRGEILSKSSFNLVGAKTYKLSVLLAGNGKSATLPQDGFAHNTCSLEIRLTNSVFQQVLTVDRLAAFAWYVFDGITVGGATTVQIRIVSLDPVGPVFSPTPNSSGYGAYIKEIKLENITDAIVMFDDAF